MIMMFTCVFLSQYNVQVMSVVKMKMKLCILVCHIDTYNTQVSKCI